jgi:hypothetical protein
VQPVKRKTAEDVRQAFESIFTASDRVPNKGKEFLNRQVQGLFKHHAIHHFTSQKETKAAVVGRFNRTLKKKMWRYFTEMCNHRHLDALQGLVASYNATRHRSIGMASGQVTHDHEQKVWIRLNKPRKPLRPFKFTKGVQVRL